MLKLGFQKAPRAAQRIYVRPDEISYFVPGFSRIDSGRVVDGDWDLNIYPLLETPKMVICRRRFVEGLDWEEAGAFELMRKSFEQEQAPDGCRTWEDVYRKYEKLDRMFVRLKENGRFYSRKKLGVKKSFREYGGVYVHVGRSGQVIFAGGGFHRLAMALYAGIEIIPAQVGIIHPRALKSGDYYRLVNRVKSVAKNEVLKAS